MPTPSFAPTAATDLPLAFCAPPGWPTPTAQWTAAHLGWQPPPGWVPVSGCPHSPPQFVFWHRNGAAWARLTRPYLRSARRNFWAGIALSLLGTAVLINSVVTDGPSFWNILHVIALITVATKTVQARTSIGRIQAELLHRIRDTAETQRAATDRADYSRYLRSTSDA